MCPTRTKMELCWNTTPTVSFNSPSCRSYLLSMSVVGGGGSGRKRGRKSTGHKQRPTCGQRPGTAGAPHAACTQNTLICETMWTARRPGLRTLTPIQHPDISTVRERVKLKLTPRTRPYSAGPGGPHALRAHTLWMRPRHRIGVRTERAPQRPLLPLPVRIDPARKKTRLFFWFSRALNHFFQEGSETPSSSTTWWGKLPPRPLWQLQFNKYWQPCYYYCAAVKL